MDDKFDERDLPPALPGSMELGFFRLGKLVRGLDQSNLAVISRMIERTPPYLRTQPYGPSIAPVLGSMILDSPEIESKPVDKDKKEE